MQERYYEQGWKIEIANRVAASSFYSAEAERGYPRFRFEVVSPASHLRPSRAEVVAVFERERDARQTPVMSAADAAVPA